MAATYQPEQSAAFAVRQGREVVVRMPNDIGILFELSTLLSSRGVNILAVSGGVCGNDCIVRLVTTQHLKAREVLEENRFQTEEEDVVLVEMPHTPGMLKQVTKTLAQAGIDIRHIYAAATEEQAKCLLVFHSSNNAEAMLKLRQGETA